MISGIQRASYSLLSRCTYVALISICYMYVHLVLREMTGGTLALLLCALVFSTVTAHPMSPWNDDALISLREKLKLHLLMSTGLSDKLERAAGGFMDHSEAQTVTEQPGRRAQIEQVIEVLRGKRDEDFTCFLEMLRATNNSVWAEELRKKAEQFKREYGKCV